MIRITLVMRIAMIVIIALTCVWIVAITRFYRSSITSGEAAFPPPEHIAALVELLEHAPPETHTAILRAVASQRFAARIETSGVRFAAAPSEEIDAAIEAAYAEVLQDRAFVLAPIAVVPEGRWLARISAALQNALEIRVALRTGSTLVIESHSSLIVTPFGVPVGLGAGLFGTIVALIALLIMQRETRPLARLAAALDRLDLAGEPIPLPNIATSAPEIRAVVKAFDRLQTRLAELLRARMSLVGGIAHDVRTFATRLRLRVDRIPDEEERQRAILDIEDMTRLLDDALLSGRAGVGELARELIEFDELVRSEIADRRSQGARLRYECGPCERELCVLGDRLALRRIIANILDNAIKYGRAADLRLHENGERISLCIDDEGPGIPAARRKEMLEPFTRLEGSRSRSTGGAGLGLAVANTLAQAHGGAIEIGDTPTGARVILHLPLFVPNVG